ncbi:MAG: tetratricopeptide repeat protein [Aggregatilineales bacterium]
MQTLRLKTIIMSGLLVLCLILPAVSFAQEETPEPLDIEALIVDAVTNYEDGFYDEAITAAQAVLEVDPANLLAARIVADSYRMLDEDILAAEAYTQVIELDPRNPDGYFYRGLTTYRTEDYDQNERILADLNNALEFGFSDRAWLYNVRGLTHERLGNIDSALEDFAAALEISPSYSVVYTNRAFLLGETLGRWADSLEDRKYVLEELRPNDAGSFNGLAWAYVQLGQYQEALGYAQLGLEIEPDELNTIDTRGWAYWGLGEYENAILDFEFAVEGGLTYSYYGLGAVYNSLGDTETALDYLNLYVESEGDDLDQAALDLLAELEGE